MEHVVIEQHVSFNVFIYLYNKILYIYYSNDVFYYKGMYNTLNVVIGHII